VFTVRYDMIFYTLFQRELVSKKSEMIYFLPRRFMKRKHDHGQKTLSILSSRIFSYLLLLLLF
jgi:hypothetical protein